MTEVQDSEATLGTSRMLGLFFGLVVMCAVFFAFGFTLGRSTAPVQAAENVAVPADEQHGLTASGAPKPVAGVVADIQENKEGSKEVAEAACATGENCAAAPTRDELTFYKAVSQKDPEAKLLPPDPPPSEAPAVVKATPASARFAGGYAVQVAAVSRKEDAEALASALRKKQYTVFTTTNIPSDKLVRVQVGPFTTLKDAEATRTRLRNDGYNPILKK
ncbi:MAG: SPOR domain-containing protein [Candidatus Korobacteraceae bacterium]